MGEIEWTELPADSLGRLKRKLKLTDDEVEAHCTDSEIRLFDSEGSFWDWYLDPEIAIDLFHELRLKGDTDALQYGSIKNCALVYAGAFDLGHGYTGFSNIF